VHCKYPLSGVKRTWHFAAQMILTTAFQLVDYLALPLDMLSAFSNVLLG